LSQPWGDNVGNFNFTFGVGVSPLTNGNYVISSPKWYNSDSGALEAGAVTWCNGTGGTSGTISAANSLIGTNNYDHVGNVTALANGNYVVSSYEWDNGAIGNAGAATWADGTIGITGTITADNSLVGSRVDDQISSTYVYALSNGNYVVCSPFWTMGRRLMWVR